MTVNDNNNILTIFKKSLINILIRHTIWPIALIISILSAIFIPEFWNIKNLLNIFCQMIPIGFTIYAMSLCLMTGFMDISLESTYVFAPVIGVIVMTKLAPNFPGIAYIGVIITIMCGIFVGLINGFLSFKIGINPFLITLSSNLFLRGIALFLIPIGVYNLPRPYVFLGSYRIFNNILPISVVAFLILVFSLNWMLFRKPIGRHILGIGSNELAAYLTGINTQRTKILVFAIAGMLAAIGGLLAAGRQEAIFNTMGEGTMVLHFAGSVLGGVSLQGGEGSIIDVLGGIFVLQMLSNIIILSKINPYLSKAAFGLILLIALLLQSIQAKLTNSKNR